MNQPPLIAHVIHQLATGGLENGLVNLINRLPAARYRHAIVCMTDYSDFRLRLRREDVQLFSMHKRPGQDFAAQWRLLRLFRHLKPAIVHSRNLSALDSLLPAAVAGVPVRIHGEHGRDERDPDGTHRRLIWLRRLHSPLISHYVSVSEDLACYMRERVGIAASRLTRIYNGVDVERFHPPGVSAAEHRLAWPPSSREAWPASFRQAGVRIIGTVGRLQPVKDPCNLVRAFGVLAARAGPRGTAFRLAIIGDGPLRAEVERLVRELRLEDRVWMAGSRDEVPELMRGLDVFVLPSLGEGISNTILEAMATGLPIVATRVGGNPELIVDGETGTLVPRSDPEAMAQALLRYEQQPALLRRHGLAGRDRAVKEFSLAAMTAGYDALYERYLRCGRKLKPGPARRPLPLAMEQSAPSCHRGKKSDRAQ